MGNYSYSNSVQTVTVGTTGTYDIVAYGGAGGGSSGGGTYSVAGAGGKGAEVGGNFDLTAGEVLKIVVGGAGTASYMGAGGGGGGASLVLSDIGGTYTTLIVAGGGGGRGYSIAGNDASVSVAKGTGAGGTGGRYGGGGGGGGTAPNGSDGLNNQNIYTGQISTGGAGGHSIDYGGSGGAPGNNHSPGRGGFGGGGGGGGGYYGGGGGGGYTGGNGGSGIGGGYAGTSLDNGLANAAQTVSAANAGAGSIRLTLVCYVTGTLIRTTRGDVAVEALQLGDLAVTASGAHRPIKWLGHRGTDCARHPEPRKVWPVRVAAGALGVGLPNADLWLSPGHALCLDDVLYPVRALVHGDLIEQVELDTVTYWHVELDSHDILIANGVQAESYLDTGNRSAFDNAAGVVDLHPDFDARSTDGFCRPYAESGPLLAAARFRLFGKAQPAATPAVHLVADGLVLTPARCGNTLTFVVPERTLQLRLASPRRRGNGADIRMLGVLIDAITIETSAGRHDITLDDPRLFAGFHDVERTATTIKRWTDGAGHFANDLWAEADGAFVMRLTGLFDVPADEGAIQIAA